MSIDLGSKTFPQLLDVHLLGEWPLDLHTGIAANLIELSFELGHFTNSGWLGNGLSDFILQFAVIVGCWELLKIYKKSVKNGRLSWATLAA